MAKFQASVYQNAKRARAFSLYQEPDALGKRRSMAAIAQMIGASASAVTYWKRTDEWDRQLLASIEEQLADADKTTLEIKKTLRDGLNRHILTLSRLITDTKLPADKINAIKAFVHVCKELEVLKPDTGGADLTPPPQFKDDIAQPQPVPADQGPDGTGASTDGAPESAGEPSVDAAVDLSELSADHVPGSGDDSVEPGPGGDVEAGPGDDLELVFRQAGL